ncbi:MAG: exodeoxyribonuclease VII small subunit, partial [Ilumatobacteraceae bacterium]
HGVGHSVERDRRQALSTTNRLINPNRSPTQQGDTQMPRKKDTEEVGYEDAVTELEEILSELSDDDIDVDHLAERVKRATELVKICRDRIAAARLEVRDIELPEESR